MKFEFKQILFGVFFVALSCLNTAGQEQKSPQVIPTVAYCDLVREPASYNNKIVRVEAFYTFGFEASFMYEESCAEKRQLTWISFDSANEKTTNPEIWKKYQSLTNELLTAQTQNNASCKIRRLRLLWTGIFTGVKPTFKVDDRVVSQGFGHMNSYSFKFMTQKIEAVTKVEEIVPCS